MFMECQVYMNIILGGVNGSPRVYPDEHRYLDGHRCLWYPFSLWSGLEWRQINLAATIGREGGRLYPVYTEGLL